MKRTISLLLTFVMVIGMFSCILITASAASVSDLTFTLNSDGKSYSVGAKNKSMTGKLVIPSTFAGYPVTSISKNGFYQCSKVESITIPNSVVKINDYAFSDCTNLTSITIPDSVNEICYRAFYGCKSLKAVVIPDGITNIPDGAFNGCKNLSSVKLPESLIDIGEYAFGSCGSLKSIKIPESVTHVGGHAFSNCSNLTSINIPNNVTTIEDAVFNGCNKLPSINIPADVTKIGDYAFSYCDAIKNINLPDGITYIGDEAFVSCDNLVSIVIPKETTFIGEAAFWGCESLSSIVLQNKLEEIDWRAFQNCNNLKNTYFTGNEAEWNNIEIGHANDALYNNVVFNYDPLKPFAPKTTTTNEIGGVKVSWNEVDNATKYVVFRRQAGTKSWVNVGTTTGTTLLDKNVKSGVYYCYSVRAYGSTGKYSDFVQANTSTRKYMATPKLTTIYNHVSGLAMKWNAVAGVTNGYRVYRRGAGSTYWTYLGTTKNLYFIDSQVKNKSGEYFRYTVIADGGYHSKFDTTGLYLKRLANPTLNSAVSSKSGITVKWSAIKGTTGYYVYRKTANSTWVRIAAVGGTNNTTFLDKTAKKGTTYTYTVKAVYGATTSAYNAGISCKDKY